MIIFLWLLINRCKLFFFQAIYFVKFDFLYKFILFKIFIFNVFFVINKTNVDMFNLNIEGYY